MAGAAVPAAASIAVVSSYMSSVLDAGSAMPAVSRVRLVMVSISECRWPRRGNDHDRRRPHHHLGRRPADV